MRCEVGKRFSVAPNRTESGPTDNTVRVWNMETGEPLGYALFGHSDENIGVKFLAGGRRVESGSDDGTMKVRDPETRRKLDDALHRHSNAIFVLWMRAAWPLG